MMTNDANPTYFKEALIGVFIFTGLFFFTAVVLKILDSPQQPMGDVITASLSMAQTGFGGIIGLFGGKATVATKQPTTSGG
jgi:hypothetical protein